MRKIIVLFVSLLSIVMTSDAQNAQGDEKRAKQLLKENADMVKSLKKQMNLRKVMIEFEENGNWHYSVEDKRGWMGIVDKNGRTIIEPYYLNLKYIPALPEGTDRVKYGIYGEEAEIWHPARPAHYVGNPPKARLGGMESNGVFMGFQKTSIIGADGKVLHAEIDYMLTPFPGYYAVGVRHLSSNTITLGLSESGHKVGLMTSLGDMLLEPEYDFINIQFGTRCNTAKWVDNILKHGGMNLRQPGVVVPCVYEDVSQNADGQWMVKLNRTSKPELWNPGAPATLTYRDEGEKLYDQFRYDDVVKYYTTVGVGAPWAKFFTASSLYHQASYMLSKVNDFHSNVVTYKEANAEVPVLDFQQVYNQLDLAASLFELYMQMDSEFKEETAQELKWCRNNMKDLAEGGPQSKYNEAVNTQAQLRAESLARQQAEQRERAAAAQQFANTMSTLLNNIQAGMNTSSVSAGVGTGRNVSSNAAATSSGQAERQYKKSVKKQVTCQTCRGNKKCSVCKGSGKSKARYNNGELKMCDACNGSGECFICDGKGYKETWVAE